MTFRVDQIVFPFHLPFLIIWWSLSLFLLLLSLLLSSSSQEWKKKVGWNVFVFSFFLESENFLDEHFIHEVGETIESKRVANTCLDVIHDFCLELCSRSQDAVYSISKERRAEDLRLLFSNVNKQSREIICPPLFGKVVLIFTRRLGGLLFMVASRNVNDHTLAIYRILYHS